MGIPSQAGRLLGYLFFELKPRGWWGSIWFIPWRRSKRTGMFQIDREDSKAYLSETNLPVSHFPSICESFLVRSSVAPGKTQAEACVKYVVSNAAYTMWIHLSGMPWVHQLTWHNEVGIPRLPSGSYAQVSLGGQRLPAKQAFSLALRNLDGLKYGSKGNIDLSKSIQKTTSIDWARRSLWDLLTNSFCLTQFANKPTVSGEWVDAMAAPRPPLLQPHNVHQQTWNVAASTNKMDKMLRKALNEDYLSLP